MPTREIEVILSRQLADCLSVPIFITDTNGDLLFYNEPAENILGKRFDDTGPLPVAEWASMFKPEDAKGNPLDPDELPLVKTLTNQQPAQGNFWIESLTGEKHHISVTTFPIVGRANRYLGAIAVFWTNNE